MIELGNRPTVVMQATPFCFGPVSTSLAVAHELRKRDVAIVWLACGTSLSLLKRGNYSDYVIEFDLNNKEHRERWSYIIEEASAVVSNTDPEFLDYALTLNTNVTYIDILYWMWDSLPKGVNSCSRYLYEDFSRTADQVSRIGLPSNAQRVGPLIIPPSELPRDPSVVGGHLLVSVGGLFRPDTESRGALQRYGELVQNSLMQALLSIPPDTLAFREVYLAGGGFEDHATVLENGITIKSGVWSKEKHQYLIDSAAAVILSPGVTGFYEVAASKKPTLFLPPHNYSAFLELETFRTYIPDKFCCTWSSLGIEADLPRFLPEQEMLKRVDQALVSVVQKHAELKKRMVEFLYGGFKQFSSAHSQALLDTLELNGSSLAAQTIIENLQFSPEVVLRPGTPRAVVDQVPLPRKLTVDLFGGCQLRCPLCPTGNRLRPGPASGPIKLEIVNQILAELGDSLEVVEFFNWGEPFLNPDTCSIVKKFSARGIKTILSSNLQKIPDPRELLDSGLDELIVSCHGFSQESYVKYMRGGKLQTTLDNLARILAAKNRADKLLIIIRFVVFSHNEHEVESASKYFSDLGVRFEPSPMRIDMRAEVLHTAQENIEQYGSWIPDGSRFYDKQSQRARRSAVGCNLPFEQINIGVDGAVSFCCSSYDSTHEVGNIVDKGLANIWNGPLYQLSRNILNGASPADASKVICHTCKNNGFRDF